MTPYRTAATQPLHDEPSGGLAAQALQLKNCQVFFDFDNTITAFDVLDGIIERFSVNRDWIAYEEAWKKGKIGSRQCLDGQLRSIRVERAQLHAYLATVGIDASFGRLLALLRRHGVEPVIVSDSFTQLIGYILAQNGISGIPVHANSLRMHGNCLFPSFPHTGTECSRCGHCKTATLASAAFAGKRAIYIGDGLSDLCPARRADLVFAKRGCSLQRHLLETGGQCQPFDDLSDIYTYFKGYTDETDTHRRLHESTRPATI
jgi:2-hydroxy-3-keto-5-methylthiopentenyl-1-phosphate phosphatase